MNASEKLLNRGVAARSEQSFPDDRAFPAVVVAGSLVAIEELDLHFLQNQSLENPLENPFENYAIETIAGRDYVRIGMAGATPS
jgi:hypothetical protein